MRMDLILGRRVLKNGLVLATTLITCTALQANEHEDKQSQGVGGPQSSERATGSSNTARQGGHQEQQKFVKKALMGGQMEVRMGQLAQQKGQNQEVKRLGEALVRDHTQANQQLQEIAQTLNISATGEEHDKLQAQGKDHEAGKHQKHQQHLSKLENQSGAEFDKEFVKMAIKHHKKDISEFERAQNQVQDQQLKSFIQQTLPKLRQHLQMAQTAARSVGVDESTIAADETDTDSATGAPAAGQIGTESPDVDVKSNVDTSGDDKSASIEVDADDNDDKLFQKGDGKVLGLPTSKTDGKYLGIIPKPGAKDGDADASIEADVNTDSDTSVGGAARNESGTSTDRDIEVDVDADVDKK